MAMMNGGVVDGVVVDAVPVVARDVTPTRVDGAVYHAGAGQEAQAKRRANKSSGGVGVLFVHVGTLSLDGSFVVPRTINLFVVMHGAKVDMRRATFVHPNTTINVFACLGGVKVMLPPNVACRVSGMAVLGGLHKHDEGVPPPSLDAPSVNVHALTVLGGCKLHVDPRVPACVVVP